MGNECYLPFLTCASKHGFKLRTVIYDRITHSTSAFNTLQRKKSFQDAHTGQVLGIWKTPWTSSRVVYTLKMFFWETIIVNGHGEWNGRFWWEKVVYILVYERLEWHFITPCWGEVCYYFSNWSVVCYLPGGQWNGEKTYLQTIITETWANIQPP